MYTTIGSNLDVYYPPTKRPRSIFEAIEREQYYQEPGIEVLPDECLFEIFRRLPSGKERSSCACVSKRWLMLMSTICKDEIERVTSVDFFLIELSLSSTTYTREMPVTQINLAFSVVCIIDRQQIQLLTTSHSFSSRVFVLVLSTDLFNLFPKRFLIYEFQEKYFFPLPMK